MIPEAITETYDDFDGLRLSIDRYLKTLAYFKPKVVIHKNDDNGWTLTVYNHSEWETYKLKEFVNAAFNR